MDQTNADGELNPDPRKDETLFCNEWGIAKQYQFFKLEN